MGGGSFPTGNLRRWPKIEKIRLNPLPILDIDPLLLTIFSIRIA